ncbi:hypothetical protein Tco_1535217 [Tanacetum coccineum]|uniref:Uncharacterized protein n=1 Tax=Tanacetum coccineum TaxID=301880 RepID=A0ABQ5IT38_9ASTR
MKVGRRWWVEGGEEWRLLAGYDGRRAAVGGDDGVTMVLKWVGGRWRGGDGGLVDVMEMKVGRGGVASVVG